MNEFTHRKEWTLPGETWHPVNVWDGYYFGYYEVSDFARCRSLDRHVPHAYYGRQFVEGRVLTQGVLNAYGHLGVQLWQADKGRGWLVHVLVARAFLGDCPNGFEVCHGPAGKLDNRPSNISYGTRSANMRDQRRDGTNYALNKTHCPRQHVLAPPNLVAKRWREHGQRICLACVRAKSAVHNARTRHGITLDFLVEADRHYALIMGEAA